MSCKIRPQPSHRCDAAKAVVRAPEVAPADLICTTLRTGGPEAAEVAIDQNTNTVTSSLFNSIQNITEVGFFGDELEAERRAGFANPLIKQTVRHPSPPPLTSLPSYYRDGK